MKITKWLLSIVVFIPTLVIGESQEQFYEQYHSKNMSGWKGIVFVCSFDASDKVLESICQRAVTDIELLAASNKVELKVAEPNKFEQAALIATANKFVTLEYELVATQGGSEFDAIAIYARLAFEAVYSNAVENDSKPNTIGSLPRSGDLELWSKTVIGSGDPSDIVDPFSDASEIHIKKALTLFIKYAK